MKPSLPWLILKLVIFPLILFAIGVVLLVGLFRFYPKYTSFAVLLLLASVLIHKYRINRKDRARGWRVGHRGKDNMFYDERQGAGWLRITLGGEMISGEARHIIYFDSEETWKTYPAWARDRRDEIISRIKSQFRKPQYEYSGD